MNEKIIVYRGIQKKKHLLRRTNSDKRYPASSGLGFIRVHTIQPPKEQKRSLMFLDPLIEWYLPIIWG